MNSRQLPLFRRDSWLAVLAGTVMGGSASAGDLFQLTGATTDGGPAVTFDESSNNLSRFIQDLVGGTGQFHLLDNRAFQAGLRYGEIQQALTFNVSGINTWFAELSANAIEPGLLERQFVAGSREELEQQIEDYLKNEGADDYARFMAALNKRSVTGILDGNPNAATARNATGNYMEYGQRPTETVEELEYEGAAAEEGRLGISSVADLGTFKSGDLTGQTYSWTPMIPYTVGKARRVRLELSLPLNYTQLEGADAFRVGSQLAVAVLAVKRTKEQPWLWQVTPHAGAVVAGSEDLVAGGLLASGGVTSYTSYRLNRWEFSMGNHISFHEGMKVTVGDYTFDPELSQQIVKNGLKIGRSLGQRWYVEGYALDTEFLQEAFTDRYLTVGLGVGYRAANRRGYLMLGTYADIGSDYQAAHAQFGTGWKF